MSKPVPIMEDEERGVVHDITTVDGNCFYFGQQGDFQPC
jgi:hypothetical protein